jgi:methionyl-tRNA synthetase
VELARFGNEYIQRHEPWKLTDDEPEAAAQVIRDCVQIAKALAVLMGPVLPGKAEELWGQLGEAGSVHDARLADALADPAVEFDEPSELFDQLEYDTVEELNAQLEARIEAADEDGDAGDGEAETETDTAAAEETEPMAVEPISEDRVPFEKFTELDIRVAEVLSAEPIEGADDLARLEVDVGAETRRIVAGIKRLHDLESLSGTRIVIVANLEKTELFGVESDGMLLAAGDQADLLTPLEDAEPGTKVQ